MRDDTSDNASVYERIQQKTVVAQVMEKIKELITSGLYKVGDKIPTEQELAERFGIGRSSIREAIKIFQHLGILESRVPKGTFLCARSQISIEAISWAMLLGDDDMWDIVELREVIEERAFRTMMKRSAENESVKQQIIEALEYEVSKMKAAVSESDIDKLVLADYNFHAAVFREGGNNLFWTIYQTLHAFMREEIRKTYEAMKDIADVSRDHQEMVNVIREGNLEMAAARHVDHFVRIKGLLTRTLHTSSPG